MVHFRLSIYSGTTILYCFNIVSAGACLFIIANIISLDLFAHKIFGIKIIGFTKKEII